MEKDIARLDAMNSNYEGRKHGKPSEIFVLQLDFAKDHPEIIKNYEYLVICNKECLPAGERIKEDSQVAFDEEFQVIKGGQFITDDSAVLEEKAMGKVA